MSRKLASIVTIASCDPIPDSDNLSVAKMAGKGWNVVTQRGEYKPGGLLQSRTLKGPHILSKSNGAHAKAG